MQNSEPVMSRSKFLELQQKYVEHRMENFPNDPFVRKLKPVADRANSLEEELSKLRDEEEDISNELIEDALANGKGELEDELRRASELCEDDDEEDS